MKHLILMCSAEASDYWICNFLIDVAVMFIMAVIILLIFLSDLYQTFHSAEVIGAIFLICTLYLMWSGLMYCYYMSSIIPKRFNGYNLLAVLHLFLGKTQINTNLKYSCDPHSTLPIFIFIIIK